MMKPSVHGDTVAQPVSDIYCCGTFWYRDQIDWHTPKILGTKGGGSPVVDFSDQIGLYLLYSGREVVHVERCLEGLSAGLLKHVKDLNWDRFSWFGYCRLSDDGPPTERQESSYDVFFRSLGGLLIETLEPSETSDDFMDLSDVKYIQAQLE